MLKNFYTLIALGALLSQNIVLAESLRKDESPTKNTRKATTTEASGFCSRIESVFIQVKMQTPDTEELKGGNTKALRAQEKSIEKSLSITKGQDLSRNTLINELTKRATTNEQKEAIEQYSSSTKNALIIRNEALSKTLASYQLLLASSSRSQKNATEKARMTFKTSLEEAKTKAVTDCTSGVPGNTVRDNLKKAIEEAQKTWKASMKNIQQEKIAHTKNSYKEQVLQIEKTYKQSMETARKNLKTVFLLQNEQEQATSTR
jgi:hypothetical protein